LNKSGSSIFGSQTANATDQPLHAFASSATPPMSSIRTDSALALTFAYPVAAQDHRWQLFGKPRHQYQYDPFQQAWSGRL
jgi:hypothetical protein